MPFGLRNVAQTFQHLIDNVLRGLVNIYAYVDDILIAISNEVQHKQDLYQVLQRLAHYNLKINLHKCIFGVEQLQLLELQIDKDGITPSTERWKQCNSSNH